MNALDLVALPVGVVTTTSFATPAVVPAGVTAVICKAFTAIMLATDPPTSTLVTPLKPVPLITMLVPPLIGPLLGATESIAGAGTTNVNAPDLVTDPPGVVTTISFKPAPEIVVFAVIEVDEATLKNETATPPIVTLVAPVKFVPAIVICVAPVVGPLVGVTLVIVGAATNVKAVVLVATPPGEVTTIV